MIQDKEVVTKKYVKSQLDPIKKDLANLRSDISGLRSDFVTRLEFKNELTKFRVDLIEEMRAIIHNSVDTAIQNSKAQQNQEMKQYIGALIEQHKEERKAFWDGIKGNTEKIDNHELRLERAGL